MRTLMIRPYDRRVVFPPVASLVSLVWLLTACRSAPVQTTSAPQPVTSPQAAAPATSSASVEAMTALARARADSARQRYTEADVEFMSNMIGHHAQAIRMSRLAPTHGASSTIQTLAGRIINAQHDEIALMSQWLRDHGKPVPDTTGMHSMMIMGGMQHEMLMPGMLTEAQLQQLDAARGTDFDGLFLTFMIQHHSGALTMVNEWISSYGVGQDEQVFKLANDVQVDQTTEIARMRRMLATLALEKRLP